MTMKVRYTVIDGEVIAEKRNGVRRQYVPDPLGSTVALLDNTQTQTDTFTYWPYGEVASRTGSTPTPFQYVGTAGYRQDSTSKTYVRARVLDPQKGQWLTQDPIGFRGGDWNLYRYCVSSPNTWIDWSGTIVYECWSHVPSKRWIPEHRWISTHRCGTYGFYPGTGAPDRDWFFSYGNIELGHDDDKLGDEPDPIHKGKRRKVPGKPIDSHVNCIVLSNDPNFEKALCKAMEQAIPTHPIYQAPFHTCINWVDDIISFACLDPSVINSAYCVGLRWNRLGRAEYTNG